MDLQLTDRRALVTGGSRGIGRAIARQLALEGADVVIVARDGASLDKAARELAAETGRKVVAVATDTAKDASVKAAVARAVEALGGLDILVNAAAQPALGPPAKLAGVTDELFWADVNVKVLGYLRMAREAAPHMITQGWGRIINVSGLNARSTGNIIGSIRNVSVASLTKNLAEELGPHGINCTVVHPGVTRTEATPALMANLAKAQGLTPEAVEARFAASNIVGRIIDASEVADVVAFLASPRSVAINGDAVPVGGGGKGAIYY